jgi:molybdate transport system substrate-binding protein
MRGSGHWLARHRFKYVWLSLLYLAYFAFAWVLLAAPPVAAQPALWECPSSVTRSEVSEAPPLPESTPVAEFPVEGGDLTVFAAASLTDAFEAMAQALESEIPNLSITYNFGGSLTLVTQLKEGAQAEVFASANIAQMDAAIAADLVSGTPAPIVHNRQAIVTPAGNPAGIQSAADLGKEGLLLVLAQSEVPVGRYGRESVCLMATDTATYGEGFIERVAANVVWEEDVRDVLANVTLGEADAGIIYVSDAAAAGNQVQVIDIPDEVNVIATYPVAVLAGGDEALGSTFVAYLLSEDGPAMLER